MVGALTRIMTANATKIEVGQTYRLDHTKHGTMHIRVTFSGHLSGWAGVVMVAESGYRGRALLPYAVFAQFEREAAHGE